LLPSPIFSIFNLQHIATIITSGMGLWDWLQNKVELGFSLYIEVVIETNVQCGFMASF
jgi:hypothetical protein